MNANYINYLRAQKMADGTISTYTQHIRLMLCAVDKDDIDITALDLLNWQASISDLASSTINLKIAAVQSYFQFLKAFSIIDVDPSVNLVGPKVKSKEKQFMNASMISAMIEAAHTARDRAMLLCIASTGLRISEATSITLAQYLEMLDSEDGFIKIVGKGNKERRVYINSQTCRAINGYLRNRPDTDCPYLFLSFGKCGKYGKVQANNFGQTLKSIAKRAGIPFWEEVSPHWLRAACASIMSERGVPIATIRDTLAHSNLKTTSRYIKTDTTQLKNANEVMMF